MDRLPPAALLGPFRQGRRSRALAQGDLVNIGRARLVIIFCQPVSQLGVTGRVIRTHVFDVERMAHEPLVTNLCRELVCFRKTPALHCGEELAIGFAVGTAQYFRAPDARCLLAARIGPGRVSDKYFAPGRFRLQRRAGHEKQRGCHGNRTQSPTRRARGEMMKCPPFHPRILTREAS